MLCEPNCPPRSCHRSFSQRLVASAVVAAAASAALDCLDNTFCPVATPAAQRARDSSIALRSSSALFLLAETFRAVFRACPWSQAEFSHEAHDGSVAMVLRRHRGVRFKMASLRRRLFPSRSSGSSRSLAATLLLAIARFPLRSSCGWRSAGEGGCCCRRRRSLRTLAGGHRTKPPGKTLVITLLVRRRSFAGKALQQLALLLLLMPMLRHNPRRPEACASACVAAGLLVIVRDGGVGTYWAPSTAAASRAASFFRRRSTLALHVGVKGGGVRQHR